MTEGPNGEVAEMRNDPVPRVVVDRLPAYLRILQGMKESGESVVSSVQLGEQLGVTDAQVRKDFSFFGSFGRKGRGYDVSSLVARLEGGLGLDRAWNTCLIGAGPLGWRALGGSDEVQTVGRYAAGHDLPVDLSRR